MAQRMAKKKKRNAIINNKDIRTTRVTGLRNVKYNPRGRHKVCEFKNETQLSFENIQNTSGIFRLTSNQLLPVAFMISNEV